jgi:hypothetical protein
MSDKTEGTGGPSPLSPPRRHNGLLPFFFLGSQLISILFGQIQIGNSGDHEVACCQFFLTLYTAHLLTIQFCHHNFLEYLDTA